MKLITLTTVSLPTLSIATGQVTTHSVGASIWHVEAWDASHIATADYQGNVCLRAAPDYQEKWRYPSGSFVFDLRCSDLDQDGQMETLFATADGELCVLDSTGNPLWKFKSPYALFSIAVGNFAGDNLLEIACGGIDRKVHIFDSAGSRIGTSSEVRRVVHRLAAGNLQGDYHDEILLIEDRMNARLMSFEKGKLRDIWSRELKVPDSLINWENPGGYFRPFSIIVDDLDGNGVNEVVMGDTYFNKQAVMVTDNQANPLWISDGLPPFSQVDLSQVDFYSTAFVRTADVLEASSGMEIISVAGSYFRIWSKDGELLDSFNGRVGFTDIEVVGQDLILGSSPNGDDQIYSLKLNGNWKKSLADLEYTGLVGEIKSGTREIRDMVMDYEGTASPGQEYGMIIGFSSIETSEAGLKEYNTEKAWLKEAYPYGNLEFIKRLKVMENEPTRDENGELWFPYRWKVDSIGGTSSVDKILEKARWIEENKVPALFVVGHSCMPFITLSTAENILKAAPDYTRGFITAEDEQIELIPRYFRYFMKGLADLCLQYGNKLCGTKNKGLWWISSPSDPWVFDAMFENGRNRVTLAATEDSNSRTPELNLMGRGGLWQAGLLKNNEVSIHSDLFSFNRWHQWEYIKTGHPFLRLLIAHTTVGMTQVNTRIRGITLYEEGIRTNTTFHESAELFIHMLGKGIVFSPAPEDAMGYSPIGIVMHRPPEKWLSDAHNGHAPEKWVEDDELHNAVIPHNGSLWGNTTTPDHALTSVLFNKKRQFGYQVPPTPYGLVALVPEFTNLESVAHVREWWHTDGISIWRENGRKFTGLEAASLLRDDFSRAAGDLPFRQVDTENAVFMNALRVADNHYRIFLVDPGWLDPQDHDVTIQIQLPGTLSAHNTITGDELPLTGKSITLSVPAGLFAIVDLVREP